MSFTKFIVLFFIFNFSILNFAFADAVNVHPLKNAKSEFAFLATGKISLNEKNVALFSELLWSKLKSQKVSEFDVMLEKPKNKDYEIRILGKDKRILSAYKFGIIFSHLSKNSVLRNGVKVINQENLKSAYIWFKVTVNSEPYICELLFEGRTIHEFAFEYKDIK